ncbi:hypothetical protein [Agarilytica rhodophyticola]|uniref:hypothetical protein n=1 Tax=Agarilytica rhodophyticola TaxID=1737490 RepID=UPI000B3438CF|nr:hypothetical protein [Agarilytica rhodophyticola]
MNNNWTNFNDADDQVDFDIIPKGTLAKVRMTIKPGGYNNPDMGWTGDYATQSEDTGAVYLNCEFIILEGEYARRKIWSLVGLHSRKGEKWSQMGRAFVKAILCSARGIKKDDFSNHAMQALSITGLADLDGLEFVAKIGIDKGDENNEPRNIIHVAVTPENKHYASIMGNVPVTFSMPQHNTMPVNTSHVGYGQQQTLQEQQHVSSYTNALPQHHTTVPPQVMSQQKTTTSTGRPPWAG